MNVAGRAGGIPRGGRAVTARLGELLVARRALAPARLEAALASQPLSGRPIGAVLAARGWASGGAVAGALAEQWGTEAVDLAAAPPDVALAEEPLALGYLRWRLLPWRRRGGVVAYVTDRPERAAEGLAALGVAGAPVVVAPPRQLDAALARILGPVLAVRAAERTPVAESVRGLGPGRHLAALAVALAGVTILGGGTAGLALALVVLLVLNGATTVMRLAALVAGLAGRDPIATPGPRPGAAGKAAAEVEGTLAELARHRPLPSIALLVPLYREAAVLPQLVAALEQLDYPPELLEVRLLLEADDRETRAALDGVALPGWISPLVVPEGVPRTKPRALNFALDFVDAEIIGILDAEDRPAPDQLRAVALALRRAPPEVACVQCQLAWYNARENWITRCFELEYGIWFEVLLRGFRRLGLPIPLGGTSVYFRRAALERLGGWDAHNVTEDADLGMRLARRGMRCEVLDVRTEEEASWRVGGWIRQRSRWLKGYLLTWLSHMRRPGRLWRELGPVGFLAFNVLFLGGAASYLAMPLFWVALAEGLARGEALWGGMLPPVLALPLAATLAAGQGVMLGCAALAMWRRRAFDLLLWVPVLPLYWTLGALAAWKALAEIALAPYWWDKTRHGLSRLLGPEAAAMPSRAGR